MQFPQKIFRIWLLGLLLTILFPESLFARTFGRASNVEFKVTKGKIEKALSEFRQEYNRLPSEEEGLGILVGCKKPLDCTKYKHKPLFDKRYLLDPWKNPYIYKLRKDGTASVITLGNDGKAGGKDYDADIDILSDDLDSYGPVDYWLFFDRIFLAVFGLMLLAIPVALIKGYKLVLHRDWQIFFAAILFTYLFSFVYIWCLFLRL